MMEYLSPEGQPIDPALIKGDKARSFYELLTAEISYVKLVACFEGNEGDSKYDTVVFDTEPEIPQHPRFDIRSTERISVRFYRADHWYPEVHALRKDFPVAPHQNLRLYEYPKSLCLYEESYEEVKTHWTPVRFLSRIRHWLAETARGTLHDENQPLEPFLPGSNTRLIVDPKVSSKDQNNLFLAGVKGHFKQTLWLSTSKQNLENQGLNPSYAYALVIDCEPVTHGVVRKTPVTVNELHNILSEVGTDLISFLRKQLSSFYQVGQATQRQKDFVVLLVNIPLRRNEEAEVEALNRWGFVLGNNLGELGQDVGVWSVSGGQLGLNLVPDSSKDGQNTKIDLLNVTDEITVEHASLFNQSKNTDRRIAIVGLGALGSHVANALVRSGYKNQTFIDEDIVLPHNLARHIATSGMVGIAKSDILAVWSQNIFADGLNVKPICDDVVRPKKFKSEIDKAFNDANLILDLSATVATSRYVSDHASKAIRVCAFLSPSGSDLVILVESSDRSKLLNSLEHQYYRYIAETPTLSEHLAVSSGTLRYGGSCRDKSSRVPIDNIHLFSSVISGTVKRIVAGEYPEGLIGIWKLQPDFSVTSMKLQPAKTVAFQIKEWKVISDSQLLSELDKFRKSKLPNETGGVLLGSFDSTRKEIYVGAVIYSPEDSIEWPTSYIRGSKGVLAKYEHIQKTTAGKLSYLGEWHTHGDSSVVGMSNEDQAALDLISKEMAFEGVPTLMLILGKECQHIEIRGREL